MSTNMVKLAIDKKPEDFKEAIVSELNSRIQAIINDKREEISLAMFGEELINKHDKTEEKKTGNVPPASDPKAKAPGAMGHEQEDEKKTGDKKAKVPTVKEENDNKKPDFMKNKDKKKSEDKDDKDGESEDKDENDDKDDE